MNTYKPFCKAQIGGILPTASGLKFLQYADIIIWSDEIGVYANICI